MLGTVYYMEEYHNDVRVPLVCVWLQPPAPILVKMEGPAQLLTFAPVMWGGQECSVKQVGEE